jgi:curved DNA-binding protein
VPLSVAMNGGEEIISLQYPDGNTKRIKLHIPKGIMPGEAVKLKGQGINGGNLVVRIQVKEQKGLKLEGRDLIMDLPGAPWEAALNEKVRVKTPGNMTVDIKLKPGLYGGKRLRITGQGYTDRKGQKGDLYVEVNVVVPKSPSEEEKKLYKELKNISQAPRRDG